MCIRDRLEIDPDIRWSRTGRIQLTEEVTVTLTKKTAEGLAEYLKGVGLKVSYIHADVDAIERVEILRALRARRIDVLEMCIRDRACTD